ncbi:MAG: EI24 domain-containing protein [Rhodospirillaceae bacterium]|nr:EI24 domain-containing protein [Rhodospirillaceae bacterium]
MLSPFALAIGQLSDPPFRRLVLLGIAVSLALLLGLAAAISFLLAYAVPADWHWATAPAAAFGGLAGLILAWLLFPAVSAIAAGILGDRLARAVERRHYPSAPEARAGGVIESVGASLRLVLAGLVLNLIATPVYLLVPGINLVLFLMLNGYLISREYFESAAVRRFSSDTARSIRRRRRIGLWAGGIALAALLAVPGLNLLVPYLGFAAMVHIVERERRQVG